MTNNYQQRRRLAALRRNIDKLNPETAAAVRRIDAERRAAQSGSTSNSNPMGKGRKEREES